MATDMSEPSKKPLMALGKIPSVDLLKDHLGLNTAPVNVKNAFRDITIQWRKTNIGSNSQPATDLTDWHSPVVQKDLYTLAENFLADKDNAEHFWSASRRWKYDSMLQYPDDKERIIELLVQLFFKQNRAFKNNSRYGPWVHKDPDPNSSREGSTPQQIASMDTASERDAETSSRKRRRSETIQNPLSPTSNFIDLSESFGSSPPLPWDHNLPPSKDIYDMPDEQEPTTRPRTWNHNSTIPSKHSETELIEDGAPVKRRGKYGLRDRTYRRVSDGISDTEFEEMTKRPETDSDSPSPDPGYPQPQSSQRAPVAHMMVDMDLESPDDLTSRHDESSMASRTQAETVPKAKSSGSSSQMPPPSWVPKKKTSPKQKHPKSHKVILKTKKGSTASSSTLASTHAKAGPTTNYKRPSVEDVIQATTSAVSPSSRVDSEATGSMSKDLYQADGPLGATAATKQPKSLPSGLQPKPKGRPPGTKQTTSRRAPQSSTSQYTGIENNLPSPSPTRNSSTQQPSIKGKSSSSSTEATSKQRAKPQMQMNFFIITREPRDESIYWREGKIQGTSLTDSIAGVEKATQRDGIERLDLTLKTSTLEAKVPVVKDDEASWLVAKQHFAERLKAAIAKAKAKGLDENANPQIYVEPFYGMNSEVGGQEEEEDEDEEVSFLFS